MVDGRGYENRDKGHPRQRVDQQTAEDENPGGGGGGGTRCVRQYGGVPL